jgi:hypothetical protein
MTGRVLHPEQPHLRAVGLGLVESGESDQIVLIWVLWVWQPNDVIARPVTMRLNT